MSTHQSGTYLTDKPRSCCVHRPSHYPHVLLRWVLIFAIHSLLKCLGSMLYQGPTMAILDENVSKTWIYRFSRLLLLFVMVSFQFITLKNSEQPSSLCIRFWKWIQNRELLQPLLVHTSVNLQSFVAKSSLSCQWLRSSHVIRPVGSIEKYEKDRKADPRPFVNVVDIAHMWHMMTNVRCARSHVVQKTMNASRTRIAIQRWRIHGWITSQDRTNARWLTVRQMIAWASHGIFIERCRRCCRRWG